MRTANLHRSHPPGAAAPTFRPLMDLAHILEAAQASKHYYADRFCYAVVSTSSKKSVSVVLSMPFSIA